MENIVLAIHIILAILLIGAVLVQRSEGGGLGIGGGGNAKPNAEKSLDPMQKMTWGLGAAFFMTSVALTVIATQSSGTASILDDLDGISVNTDATETIEIDPNADPNAPISTRPSTDGEVDPNAPAQSTE